MRHRIGGAGTGLGNPSNELLTNKWSRNKQFNALVKKMLSEAIYA